MRGQRVRMWQTKRATNGRLPWGIKQPGEKRLAAVRTICCVCPERNNKQNGKLRLLLWSTDGTSRGKTLEEQRGNAETVSLKSGHCNSKWLVARESGAWL